MKSRGSERREREKGGGHLSHPFPTPPLHAEGGMPRVILSGSQGGGVEKGQRLGPEALCPSVLHELAASDPRLLCTVGQAKHCTTLEVPFAGQSSSFVYI